MVVPARPTAGAPIDSTWGGVAHDTAVGQDIQTGSASVSLAGSSQGSVVVTFPRPFASSPAVSALTISPAGASLGLITQASAVSATAVTLRLATASGANLTAGPFSVSWIAIGPRA